MACSADSYPKDPTQRDLSVVGITPDKILIFSVPPGGSVDPDGGLKNSFGMSKGSLIASDGAVITLLGPGADGNVLTLDSTQALGIKWAPGGGGGSNNIVTFQPTGARVESKTTAGTVFSDFGLLCAFIATVGTPTDRWTIQLDGSLVGGTVTIPAGTYPLPLSANPANPGYPGLMGTSVVFSPAPAEVYFVNIRFAQFDNPAPTPTPVISANNTVLNAYLVNTQIGGAVPVFAASNAGFVNLQMYGVSAFGFSDSSDMLAIDATSSAAITVVDLGDITNGSLAVPDGVVSIAAGGTFSIGTTDSAKIGAGYFSMAGVAAMRFSDVQAGTVTLVNGVSPAISAILSATSRITMSYSAMNTTTVFGTLITASRVFGNPGTFVIQSMTNRNINTADQSTVDWHIVDSGH